MPRVLTRLLPFLAGATIIGLAGPAVAADLGLHDPRGDMWRQDEVGATTRAPASRQGDVVAAHVSVGTAAVVVSSRYADLARAGRYANYTVRLQSGRHLTREVTLETGPGDWRGSVRVFRGNGDLAPHCHPGHHIDYAANTVRITVPATCLERPVYVRANLNSSRANARGTFFLDDPQNRKAGASRWTHWIHRG